VASSASKRILFRQVSVSAHVISDSKANIVPASESPLPDCTRIATSAITPSAFCELSCGLWNVTIRFCQLTKDYFFDFVTRSQMNSNVLNFSTPDPERPDAHFGGATVNFQPSEDVRKRYFSTRKHSFSLAGVTFPGLFSKPPESDLSWFKIAVLIEIVTAIVLSAIVVSVYNLPLWSGLLPFLGFVGIDVALAILHHWPVPLCCLHKNQALLVVPDLRAGIRRATDQKYRDFLNGLETKEIVWHRWLSTLSFFLILVVAAGKTLFLSANIQELGSLFSSPDTGNIFDSASPLDGVLRQDEYRSAILIIFSLLYTLVAYIHIKHTGFALAAINLTRGLKRDSHHRASDPTDKQFHSVAHEERINLQNFAMELIEASDTFFSKEIPSKETLLSDGRLSPLVTMSGQQQAAIAPHTIEERGNGTFVMIRRGMLTDEQLRAWVNMQETEFAGRVIALYGHKLQMNLVGAEDIDKEVF